MSVGEARVKRGRLEASSSHRDVSSAKREALAMPFLGRDAPGGTIGVPKDRRRNLPLVPSQRISSILVAQLIRATFASARLT